MPPYKLLFSLELYFLIFRFHTADSSQQWTYNRSRSICRGKSDNSEALDQLQTPSQIKLLLEHFFGQDRKFSMKCIDLQLNVIHEHIFQIQTFVSPKVYRHSPKVESKVRSVRLNPNSALRAVIHRLSFLLRVCSRL